MTDLELADWLENWEGSFKCEIPCGSPEAPTCMCGKRIDQIIAALRRGPERQKIKPVHTAADAFWKYWKENGETHKHGYYESTWEAINAALSAAEAEGRKECP